MLPDHDTILSEDPLYILDGGALLHRIPWHTGKSYLEISNGYIPSYVKRKYVTTKHPYIVFDGYSSGPSTKYCVHLKRTGGSCGPFISMDPNKIHNIKKDIFLTNHENKQDFIKLLGGTLHDSGCHILYSDSEADILIVETAIKLNDVSYCIVIGDDIDLVVLLIYFCSLKIERNKQLLFKLEPKQNAKKIPYCWDIRFVILNLPERVVSNILFAHTIIGCDTTSHLHSIKKKLLLKLLSTSDTSLKAAAELNDTYNSKDSIIQAGETVVTQLYDWISSFL